MNEILREFLLESYENLAQVDLDLVQLETDPANRDILARVFRNFHTVKGTSGFLGLVKLQAITHAGENLLSRLRAGELALTPEMATVLLSVVDAVRKILAALETTEQEGDGDYSELIRHLERLTRASGSRPSPSRSAGPSLPASPPPPPPPIVVGQSPSPPPPPPPIPVTLIAPPVSTAPLATSVVVAEPPLEPRAPAVADSSIRVDVGLLDKLMNLVGELVLARNQIVQYSGSQADAGYLSTVQRLNLLTTELQAGVMKTRMQPIGNVWGKFPRIVRDLAVACNKQVRIDMDGQDTELDKTIIEAIRDPLTHMVRNAIDHGIEVPAERVTAGKPAEGRLFVQAKHEGGKVVIAISDDGSGIDPRRVREKALANGLITPEQAARMSDRELVSLVFLPGFSTADRVTHFSGRGVGMDVVRTNIEKIGGTVDIDSVLGCGTTVKMKIPLTLAIIPALIVATGGDRYAIPQVSLLELVYLDGEQATTGIEWIHGTPVYRLRGQLLPLVYLHRQLQVESLRGDGAHYIVVVQADDRPFGLVVDDIQDTEEIVVKPLQKQLKGVAEFAGATIMGDGAVALILDVLGLAQRAGVVTGIRDRARNDKSEAASTASVERMTVLLLAAPGSGRMAIPLNQVARLEEFPRHRIERVGMNEVIQYRGEILPLIRISRVLRGSTRTTRRRSSPARETVQVVVTSGMDRHVGLIVGHILDIVETPVANRSPATRHGVLFTAVVQDRVTEFLDVEALIRTAAAGGPP